jgi:hypothetical protein
MKFIAKPYFRKWDYIRFTSGEDGIVVDVDGALLTVKRFKITRWKTWNKIKLMYLKFSIALGHEWRMDWRIVKTTKRNDRTTNIK